MAEKTVEDYVEQIFPIQCRGIDEQGGKVLEEPIDVKVRIYKSPGCSVISSIVVGCPYNAGAHGERCKASHSDKDKVGNGVNCSYAIDLPLNF